MRKDILFVGLRRYIRNMRNLVATIFVASFLMPLHAETVSQKQASQVASLFFNAVKGQVMAQPKMVYNGKNLTTDRLFTPFYVYNAPTGGFVIVSAENKTTPILAYSLTGSFNLKDLGKAENALLKNYASHIERVRYDSTVPEKAIAEWNDIRGYIADILAQPARSHGATISLSEADEGLQYVENADTYSGYSFIYTPTQWSEMINDEVDSNHSVALGVIDGDLFYPTVVTGRKGDYYNIGDWMMVLMPTETISDGYIAYLSNPRYIPQQDNQEEEPFLLVEDFIRESKLEKEKEETRFSVLSDRRNMKPSITGQPVVRYDDAGHFEAVFPSNVMVGRAYSISGSKLFEKYFKNTERAYMDLGGQPSGFYILWFMTEDGTPYSFKIHV